MAGAVGTWRWGDGALSILLAFIVSPERNLQTGFATECQACTQLPATIGPVSYQRPKLTRPVRLPPSAQPPVLASGDTSMVQGPRPEAWEPSPRCFWR